MFLYSDEDLLTNGKLLTSYIYDEQISLICTGTDKLLNSIEVLFRRIDVFGIGGKGRVKGKRSQSEIDEIVGKNKKDWSYWIGRV